MYWIYIYTYSILQYIAPSDDIDRQVGSIYLGLFRKDEFLSYVGGKNDIHRLEVIQEIDTQIEFSKHINLYFLKPITKVSKLHHDLKFYSYFPVTVFQLEFHRDP